MILENEAERYLVSRCPVQGEGDIDVGEGRRYKISIFLPGEESPLPEQRLEAKVSETAQQGGLVNGASPKLISVDPDGARKVALVSEQPSEAVKDALNQEAEPPSESHDKQEVQAPNGVTSTPDPSPAPLVETNADEATSLATESHTSPPSGLKPSQPRLQDIAMDLEESDVLFLPDGIRLAQRRLVGDPPGDVEVCSTLGSFVEVMRWRWQEPPREQGVRES